MSVFMIKLIPSNPEYVPDESSQQNAAKALRSYFPDARTIDCVVSDEVQYVDVGGNFEGVYCPLCAAQLDRDGWWVKAVDDSYNASRFRDLNVSVPCCNHPISLNDLDYRMPQGFARFVISIEDAASSSVETSCAETLERILGCKVRVIYAHY
jgi:hypothetical protein